MQVAQANKRRQDHQLLVCHDLQGGYGDDSLVQGGADPEQYSIYAWHLIDLFVYFSHRRVTIPPPSWIDAAHVHGVPVSAFLNLPVKRYSHAHILRLPLGYCC